MLGETNMKEKKKKEKLSSSIEDYLETIYILKQNSDVVRVRDISKMMGVSMPSVHQALHTLNEAGLIEHENYGYIKLTAKGRDTGVKIYHRHRMLIKFFTEILNVPFAIAEKDACLIEHNISSETLKRWVTFIKFVDTYPYPGKPDWIKKRVLTTFIKQGKDRKNVINV